MTSVAYTDDVDADFGFSPAECAVLADLRKAGYQVNVYGICLCNWTTYQFASGLLFQTDREVPGQDRAHAGGVWHIVTI